jgi:hypothetical protein
MRAYITLKRYDLVHAKIESILPLANSRKIDFRTREAIYRMAAWDCFYAKEYAKARYYLTKNQDIQKTTPNLNMLIEDTKAWYKLDSAQGNFRSAFDHLSFLKTKTDSIFGQTKQRQLQVLGVEYETAIKEDSIKLQDKNIVILTHTNSLQKARLARESLIKNVTITGIILAFVIIGLLYRQYRNKQKSNKIITQKNQQLQHYLG